MTKKTEIDYGEESFALDEVVYDNWKYQCEGVDDLVAVLEEDKELAKEWITYKTLMGEGIFVKRPIYAEPDLATTFLEPADDGIFDAPTYEPTWTQSRILQERDKLLRERERLIQAKEKDFTKRVVAFHNQRQPKQGTLYQANGKPYSTGDILVVLGILGVVLYIVSVPPFFIPIILYILYWLVRRAK